MCRAWLLASAPVAAHSLPASELPAGPRRGSDEDKGLRLAVQPSRQVSTLAGRRGQSGLGKMIMTSNKAQKSAIRQRMSETGEPYSVARNAMLSREQDADLDVVLADSRAVPEESPHDESPDDESPEHESPDEQYLRDAEAAGVPAEELTELRARFHARGHADQMRQAADRAREHADRVRDQVDHAEEAADRAEERADLAQEAADQAMDWAEPDEQRAAQARADAMREAADLARENAERAEEAAERAEEAADQAEEAADQAEEAACEAEDAAGEAWASAADKVPGRHDDRGRHHGVSRPRPPRAPRPPQLPRLPRMPKLPRLPRLPGWPG